MIIELQQAWGARHPTHDLCSLLILSDLSSSADLILDSIWRGNQEYHVWRWRSLELQWEIHCIQVALVAQYPRVIPDYITGCEGKWTWHGILLKAILTLAPSSQLHQSIGCIKCISLLCISCFLFVPLSQTWTLAWFIYGRWIKLNSISCHYPVPDLKFFEPSSVSCKHVIFHIAVYFAPVLPHIMHIQLKWQARGVNMNRLSLYINASWGCSNNFGMLPVTLNVFFHPSYGWLPPYNWSRVWNQNNWS